ncbi:ATP-dependent helicase HrpB [Novosphingopyxis sp.]|uniref:ATP-dependent helicase HrpB n=1 Tax=Novosphingopyxis sp. TaxID=2709690 RepID=UPI003B5C3DBD
MTALPIAAVLPDLRAALRAAAAAVLVAPPGAGKTTMVAPALLAEPWCDGAIWLLSPRRLAARAAAERMAELAGERVGQTIGYATRMDGRRSAATRILVLTEGIFRNRIIADPELTGISAVLFDEVHERSLDSDFGLALALEAQAAFRPDLRLVTMSATLDGARFSALMHGCPVIESAGRAHPLELVHLGRRAERRIEDEMAGAIARALAERDGDLLAFLPGMGEIERTGELLRQRLNFPTDIAILPLHGALDPAEQRAAIRPDPEGRRKIILATSIAETSLTIDGVRIVVDGGLARRPRFDQAAGTPRLVTERVSRAAAVQRAGRAARQAPGIAYRLWEEAATGGLIPYDPPEMLESDLAPLVLDCARWGEADPAALRWLDPPPAAALAQGRATLRTLEAIDKNGRITAHGETLSALPLPPHLAHMLVLAGAHGQAGVGAEVAVLCQERGLGGRGEDLEARLQRWREDRGRKAEAARGLAQRWAGLVGAGEGEPLSIGALVALAFPDRLARSRGGGGGADWIAAGGRGFRLDPASPFARHDWLAVADVQGAAGGARILSAAPIDEEELRTLFADRIETRRTVRFDAAAGRIAARREERLGAIALRGGQDDAPDPDAVRAALLEAVRGHGLGPLPWSEAAIALRRRAAFAGSDALTDEALLASLDHWLDPLLVGITRFDAIPPAALLHALEGQLGWDEGRRIAAAAPPRFTTPAGTTHAIDYGAEAGPTVAARVQAFYGLAEHPAVGRPPVPLVLSLTSPAGRPVQTTRDLPAFWTGSWADVAKDMRGRYPRHHWPDDPAGATPSLKTKRAQARSRD